MKSPPSYLPATPGVYQFLDAKDNILYIGKAKQLAKRVAQYFSPGSLRKQEMVNDAAKIVYIETPTEEDALLLEDNLIKKHLPEYNKLLRTNSNYVFLKVSRGPFPAFMIVKKRVNDGSTYIGPRYRSAQLRQMLRYLRHIFKFHTMKPSEFAKGVLSTDYFFGLDKGRSVIAQLPDPKKNDRIQQALQQGLTLEKSYDEYVYEYAQITKLVTNCFAGKTGPVLEILQQQLNEAVAQEHFERCAILRDVYQFIQTLDQSYQHVVIKKPLSGYFGTIQAIGSYRIIILLHLVDGKVVDVLREKKRQDEFDLSGLLASAGAEFGTTLLREHHDQYALCSSPTLQKLSQGERDALLALIHTSTDSFIHASSALAEENVAYDLLLQLQITYKLQRIPYEMECIDISHLGGDQMSGGLSCFIGGVPLKRRYRHYKIDSVTAGSSDDYQALKEVIVRRCKLTQEKIGTDLLPDLLVIDGGKGQLGILRDLAKDYPSITALMKKVDIIALGKGEARQRAGKRTGAHEIIYQFTAAGQIIETPLIYDHADHLLIKLRDEAHRFANRYRKIQSKKIWKK